MSWNAAVDFRKGNAEAAREEPCQGYGKVLKPGGDVIFAALADGAEDARFAHIGAKTAVRSALSFMQTEAKGFQAITSANSEADASEAFRVLLDTVRAALKAAAADQVTPVDQLATSLMAIVASPDGLAAMQIGDGSVVYRRRWLRYEQLSAAQDETAEAETIATSVTDASAPEDMFVSTCEGPMEFVCAFTDALAPLSIRAEDRHLQPGFFRPLDQCATQARGDTDVHRGIRAFLRNNSLTGRVRQDCSLLLGGYRTA